MVRRLGGLPLAARHAALPVGIRLDHARIDREALAADQPFGDAALYGRFQHLAQQIARAETAVPALREGRVIRHRAVKPEPAEPAAAEVQVDLLAQPPLRPNAEAIADDQHPDHQLRGERRPPHLLAAYPVEVHKTVIARSRSVSGTCRSSENS